jgi:hypothetical protein
MPGNAFLKLSEVDRRLRRRQTGQTLNARRGKSFPRCSS